MFEWKADYSVGVQEMDDQHKMLIVMINELEQVAGDKKREQLNDVVDKLFDYARYHIQYEEKMLKENDYPDFENHHKKHVFFEEQLSAFSIRLESEDSVLLAVELAAYLYDWWFDHIENEDKEYVDFFKQKGIR